MSNTVQQASLKSSFWASIFALRECGDLRGPQIVPFARLKTGTTTVQSLHPNAFRYSTRLGTRIRHSAFPSLGNLNFHIEMLIVTLNKRPVPPAMIVENIPVGDLDMATLVATQVRAGAFVSLPSTLTSPQWLRCLEEKH